MKARDFFRFHRTALLLSLLYLVPAMLWVLLSDDLLFSSKSLSETETYMRVHEIKDAAVVFCIGIVVFLLINISRSKLRATKLNYENLFYHHPNPMWIYEIATLKFLEVNHAAVLHYGYSREAFLSMSAKDIRPVEEVTKLYTYVSAMEKGMEHTHIWKHKKKNGEIIMVESISNEVMFRKKACYLISITDITERNKKDEQIRKLSLVAENATNSMIILDRLGYIEWVNEPFHLLCGYSMEEVKGKRPQDFLHGPETNEATRQEIIQCLRRGAPYSGEILNYHKNGSMYWIRLTVSPVFERGEIINFVTVQTDITLIKWQNKHLRDIAFTASHQFRKPLANILGIINEMEHNCPGLKELHYLKQSAEELDRELLYIVEKTAVIEDSQEELTGNLTHVRLPASASHVY